MKTAIYPYQTLKIKLEDGAKMPERAHPTDAGLDLFCYEKEVWVPANGMKMIRTGVHAQIPPGYVGLLTSKSGLMGRGLTCRGTIDSGYTGEIRAIVFNHTEYPYLFRKDDKVTQLVVVPCVCHVVEVVDSLDETERGDNGFGSTGR